jgi:glycosyltransferase involved in cell wall biosynthesis
MGVDLHNQPAIYGFPIHGVSKMVMEGYRTRDGHLIEWLGRLCEDVGPLSVVSRPEPLVKSLLGRLRPGYRSSLARNTTYQSKLTLQLPDFSDRYRWWLDSARLYPQLQHLSVVPSVVWNPFIGMSRYWAEMKTSSAPVLFDLLDDWTVHYSFGGIRREIDLTYRKMFDVAAVVTANSEATAELARRFGRDDVVSLFNGCDPDRFTTRHNGSGQITVGYVGKIGERVDVDLVVHMATVHPAVRFVFAGPILDGDFRERVASLGNVVMLGDVHYDRVPDLLSTFDLGWVPHKTGVGEVGGDVLKTYEYRASGLPVLTTPILGVGDRGLGAVHIVPAMQQPEWLVEFIGGSSRISRSISVLPESVTWEHKARTMYRLLGLSSANESLG